MGHAHACTAFAVAVYLNGDANGVAFLNHKVAIALFSVKVFEWVLDGDGFELKLWHPWQYGFGE